MVELENEILEDVEVVEPTAEPDIEESITDIILRQLMTLKDDSDEITFVDYSVIESIYKDLEQTNTIKRMLGIKDLNQRIVAAINMLDIEKQAGAMSHSFFDVVKTLSSNAEVDYYSLKMGQENVI